MDRDKVLGVVVGVIAFLTLRPDDFSMSWSERLSVARFLTSSAVVLAVAGPIWAAMATQRRIRSRYQASVFTSDVLLVACAALLLPGIAFIVVYNGCNFSEGWALVGVAGLLAAAALVLGLFNLAKMDKVSALAATCVQLMMVAPALAVGMVPALLIFIVSGAPSGGLHACR